MPYGFRPARNRLQMVQPAPAPTAQPAPGGMAAERPKAAQPGLGGAPAPAAQSPAAAQVQRQPAPAAPSPAANASQAAMAAEGVRGQAPAAPAAQPVAQAQGGGGMWLDAARKLGGGLGGQAGAENAYANQAAQAQASGAGQAAMALEGRAAPAAQPMGDIQAQGGGQILGGLNAAPSAMALERLRMQNQLSNAAAAQNALAARVG